MSRVLRRRTDGGAGSTPSAETPLEADASRSLAITWKEGNPAAIMVGIVDSYATPYALFLGATAQQIGWLVGVPFLVASVAQLGAVAVVRRTGSRRRFVVAAALGQAAVLAQAAALAWAAGPWRMPALVALLVAFRVLAQWIVSAWGSLMSEYLPADQRGRYFGFRSQVVDVARLAGIGLAGMWLSGMEHVSPVWGFSLLFLAAALLRSLSARLLALMADRPLVESPESDFSFLEFLARFRESNFVRYVLFVAGVTFATHLSAPYFSVYMLRDLGFSYINYMLVQMAAVVAGLVSFPIWGRHADIAGNAKILRITGLLVPLIPILWLVSPHPAYLIGIELIAGFVWGGFNLCATNFIFEAVTPPKRVRCLAYFSLVCGVALCVGASLGGFLADRLPPLRGHSLLTLFLLSGLLRLAAYGFLASRFREVRPAVRKVASTDLFFSVIGLRPLEGRATE
jgi:MFS family permease